MSIWDDKEVVGSDNFVKFNDPGDSVAGTITALGKHTFPDGKVAAKLELACDDGEDRTLTAGQVGLKARLAELRPEVGDHIKIVYTRSEKRDGGKTLKHFDVDVTRGGAPAATASAPAPAPAAGQPDEAAVRAAMERLAAQV